jgi:hypothetical protein
MVEIRPSPTEIVAQLRERGAVSLPGFFGEGAVARMRREALALLARPAAGVRPESNPGGAQVRVDPRLLDGLRFPAIAAVLRSEFFQRIARGYDSKSRFCQDAVISHDKVPCKITDIHFDTRPSLKFMVYLADVRKANAAFRYAYGTHRANWGLRQRFLLAGGKLNDLPNVPGPGERIDLVDCEGPAGTLLVFLTDGFHSAGLLEPGRERLLIRASTLLSGWFNNGVLRGAAELNPMRFLFLPRVPEGRKPTHGTARAN